MNSGQVSPPREGKARPPARPPGTKPVRLPRRSAPGDYLPIAFLNPAPSERLRQAVETDKEAGAGGGWEGSCFVLLPPPGCLLCSQPYLAGGLLGVPGRGLGPWAAYRAAG